MTSGRSWIEVRLNRGILPGFWFEFSQLVRHNGGGFEEWAGWEHANVDDFVLSEIRILLFAISGKGKNLRWAVRKRDMRNNQTGFPLA